MLITKSIVVAFAFNLILFVSCVHGQTTEVPEQCVLSSINSPAGEANPGYYIRPNELVECTKQIYVNGDEFISYVTIVNHIFRENYAFYNSAIDVSLNEPLNYQRELGYTLYTGINEGKININESLQKIIDQINKTTDDNTPSSPPAANASMFWEVSEIFQLLRDNHVTLTADSLGQLQTPVIGSQNRLDLILGRYFDSGGMNRFQTVFKIINETIVMTINEYDGVDVISTNRVKMINGQEPVEFLRHIANSHLYPTKSEGVRANWAMVRHFATGSPQVHIYSHPKSLSFPDILPDQFTIEYDEGDDKNDTETSVTSNNDTVFSLIRIDADFPYISDSNDTHITLDVEAIERDINKPGYHKQNELFFYKLRDESVDSCNLSSPINLNFPVIVDDDSKSNNNNDEEKNDGDGATRKLDSGQANYPFEEVFLNCGWQYFVTDNYSALKVDTFDGRCFMRKSYDDFAVVFKEGWKKMLMDSEEKGSKKLIIDVSNNGGGSPTLGLGLAMLLYNEVDYDHFVTFDNIPFNNPMETFYDETYAWLHEGREKYSVNITQQDREDYVQSFTNETYCKLQGMLDWFLAIYNHNIPLPTTNTTLRESFESFTRERTVESFEVFFGNLFDIIEVINPWTVTVGGRKAWQEETRNITETFIRGGIETKFIPNLDVLYEPWLDVAQDFARNNISFAFDEYVIVSNGYCGSSCDIFATTAIQVWRNKETTGAKTPLSVVTYGGLGETLDVAQFAGGFVERPPIERNYGPLLIAAMEGIVRDVSSEPWFVEGFDRYNKSVPDIPFYLKNWPRMPTSEGINTLMMPSGVPLEYINVQSDYYIQQIYNQITFGNPTNLIPLYDEVYRIVSSSDGEQQGNTTILTPDAPTNPPTAAATSSSSSSSSPSLVVVQMMSSFLSVGFMCSFVGVIMSV